MASVMVSVLDVANIGSSDCMYSCMIRSRLHNMPGDNVWFTVAYMSGVEGI